MNDHMMKFPHIQSVPPSKRDISDRISDFKSIYTNYDEENLKQQASRCEQCKVPFCQYGCPIQNNIPDWLNMITLGRYKEAWDLLNETSPLPEVCSRICPQDKLCEKTCVLNSAGFHNVQIGKIEEELSNIAFQNNWVTIQREQTVTEKTIAVVGSGPAGLAIATYLFQLGHNVTVYERSPHIGGLLTFGIPSFKLEKDIIFKRINVMKDAGIKFICNCEIGKDITLEDLKKQHDVCVLACGVYNPHTLNIKGEDLSGVYPAMELLVAQNMVDIKEKLSPQQQELINKIKNAKVTVIGGGDTAMDCVRTAIRMGAKSSAIVYRRDEANMPGSKKEVHNAKEEGANFIWLSRPLEIHGDENNNVKSIEIQKMRLRITNPNERAIPIDIPNAQQQLESDIVILALGFKAENFKNLHENIQLDKYNNIKTDLGGATNLNNIFAIGDCVEGASLAVKAIYNARNTAYIIDDYLRDNN